MPFVIATCSASAYTSIDSVLDNFTFWGTYLMVRDDVKVLAPAGRNQNGTLNNKLITSVMSGRNYNFNGTTDAYLLLGNDDNSDNGGVLCTAYYDYSYNNKDNTIQLSGSEYNCALCGEMKIVNSCITYLKEKETLRVGDSGPVVVETYRNGTSWYRVWSDGVIEQGGMGVTNTAALAEISLMKPYSAADYSILLQARGGTTSLTGWTVNQYDSVAGWKIDKFSVYAAINMSALTGQVASFFWYTIGK